jgi:UDP-2,4-diacetamido-2,4,6-trideoxy-beta-L-altropyranose hydrolase
LTVGARVAFRADSSQELGYGHVMRCLTLANELKLGGAQCSFFSRATPAALRELISLGGHELVEMPRESSSASDGTREDPDFLVSELPEVVDWLVVDHYGIDASWERAARACARRILVIDDLANRSHDCELLLDQNFNSQGSARYAAHIPQSCRPLLGPQFALLRPEFMQARKCAKPRTGQVERLFVFFGGADAADCTSAALAALSRLEHEWQSVDVVIGAQHRNRNRIAGALQSPGVPASRADAFDGGPHVRGGPCPGRRR